MYKILRIVLFGATLHFCVDPLVMILQEALARDDVERSREQGKKLAIGVARSKSKAFMQNIHHFRDDMLASELPPIEKVTIFDEAQRAWTMDATKDFMKRKKGIDNFAMSEPEFLVGVMDRHDDWAVIVCLIGGGQEINKGEAGLAEWYVAAKKFPNWDVFVSSQLTDSEYSGGVTIEEAIQERRLHYCDDLHLAVSIRSFRAEKISSLVKSILDAEIETARTTLLDSILRYPIAVTRDINTARTWLRANARGSERTGMLASSGALRLKAEGIYVRTKYDPVNWFLGNKSDVRSSMFLEDVGTEFEVQGLELDWACIAWDADLRCVDGRWTHWKFKGTKWQSVKKVERKMYLVNAYRVLLTRARQGMIIYVPNGSDEDATRKSTFYDGTYEFLVGIGIPAV